MPAFEDADPTKPLRSIFSEEQIEFLRNQLEEYDLDSILDKSLKDLMTSDDQPSLTELMQTATQVNDEQNGNPPQGSGSPGSHELQ